MLTKQLQLILSDIIDSKGLNHLDFKPVQHASKKTNGVTATSLEYKQSGYYFWFDLLRGVHWIEFSPASDRMVGHEYPGNWDITLNYFKRWLDILIIEIETPDIWSSYSERGKFVANDGEDNSTFSIEELRQIEIKISITKEEIKKLSIPDVEKEKINEKLDYIYEKAKTFGRIDWRSIFIGLILQLSVTPDTLKSAMKVIGQAFNSLFLIS